MLARRASATLGGMSTIASTPLAAALRSHGFGGVLVEPADAGYDAARAVWNGAVDHRPVGVALALDTADVAAAVRGARAAGVPFAARCGGHNPAGRSVPEGGLVIDLREIADVTVDPEARVVRVGGGALLGELNEATEPHGLVVPAGQVSHTGVGGLALGGGVGWLARRFGLTADSLLAAEVVLADGSVVHASAGERPDLFWGLRGAGASLGIVTEFTFRAHPLAGPLLAGPMVYPVERAREVMRASRDLMEHAPDELTICDVLTHLPPDPAFPAELRGTPVLIVAPVWCGEHEAGRRVLAPLVDAHPPALDLVGPMSLTAVHRMLDAGCPHGLRYFEKAHWLRGRDDAFLDALVERFADVTSPLTEVITGRLGGAVSRVPAGATAFGQRGAEHFAWIIAKWAQGDAAPHAAWVREVWEATRAQAAGTYVNALGSEPRPAAEAYDAATFSRVRAVKDRYDPEGAFAL
jgi:FAD/FMN-containing dehydrogenase